MSDLFGKLNVLIQSRVRSALGGTGRDRAPSPGKHADREVAQRRAQIEQAIGYEETLQGDIAALDRQIAEWDAQADAALAAGSDATARHAIRQMKLLEQRRTMAAAERDAHQRATAELIQRVNELEALLAQAQQQQQEADAAATQSLADRIARARAQVSQRPPTQRTATSSAQPTPPDVDEHPIDERAIDDDLAQRRARLSQ